MNKNILLVVVLLYGMQYCVQMLFFPKYMIQINIKIILNIFYIRLFKRIIDFTSQGQLQFKNYQELSHSVFKFTYFYFALNLNSVSPLSYCSLQHQNPKYNRVVKCIIVYSIHKLYLNYKNIMIKAMQRTLVNCKLNTLPVKLLKRCLILLL